MVLFMASGSWDGSPVLIRDVVLSADQGTLAAYRQNVRGYVSAARDVAHLDDDRHRWLYLFVRGSGRRRLGRH
jgi:hypothetical protein